MDSVNLPSGIVTFLYTDIEGSASLWERFPEPMRVALAKHDAILRETISAHGGTVYKAIGDAFQAAFPVPVQAVKAAIAIQQELNEAQWQETGPLRVRMGLHTGGPSLSKTTTIPPIPLTGLLVSCLRVMGDRY